MAMIVNIHDIRENFYRLLEDSNHSYPDYLKDRYKAFEISSAVNGWRRFQFIDKDLYVEFMLKYGYNNA